MPTSGHFLGFASYKGPSVLFAIVCLRLVVANSLQRWSPGIFHDAPPPTCLCLTSVSSQVYRNSSLSRSPLLTMLRSTHPSRKRSYQAPSPAIPYFDQVAEYTPPVLPWKTRRTREANSHLARHTAVMLYNLWPNGPRFTTEKGFCSLRFILTWIDFHCPQCHKALDCNVPGHPVSKAHWDPENVHTPSRWNPLQGYPPLWFYHVTNLWNLDITECPDWIIWLQHRSGYYDPQRTVWKTIPPLFPPTWDGDDGLPAPREHNCFAPETQDALLQSQRHLLGKKLLSMPPQTYEAEPTSTRHLHRG